MLVGRGAGREEINFGATFFRFQYNKFDFSMFLESITEEWTAHLDNLNELVVIGTEVLNEVDWTIIPS